MRLSSQLVSRPTGSGSGSASPAPAPPPTTGINRSNHRPPHVSHPPPSASPSPLPENLTHTAQSRLPQSDLSSNPVTVAEASAEQVGFPGYEGLTDEEVFRAVTRPRARPVGPKTRASAGAGAGAGAAGTALTQEEDWGIPPEVDPNEADEGLKAKVAKFLQLKYEKDQHINTTLLSSSAFANPHIYAKLVEFVSIDETATAFPSGGWITRRGLSAEIPLHGPSALQAQQKAKQEAVKRAQEAGKRSAIDFKAGKYRDDAGSGSGSGGRREKDWATGADRDRERDRERSRQGERGGEGGKGRTRTRDDEPRDREKRYRKDEGRYRDERGNAGRYEEGRTGSGSRYDRPRERR
ncbi:hypothetical protein EHS25_000555 [Saitozyma podzolica]|uniref:Uncharacterized protein n=1 Tax=Saitozyma podzolica TaxID=1890683 RepID=A0A427YWF4_9TREE|nr:hypothetical protein EHS25_000555 [Saitozyma podzolica]